MAEPVKPPLTEGSAMGGIKNQDSKAGSPIAPPPPSTKDVNDAEALMTKKVDELEKTFNEFKVEFERISAISDAFEAQCESLAAQVDLYKTLAKMSKKHVDNGDMEALKRLYVSVSV